MSQEQYYLLMSSLLKEKYALTKLREKLKGKKEKLCRRYKGFRYLACNYKNKKEEKKESIVTLLENFLWKCSMG